MTINFLISDHFKEKCLSCLNSNVRTFDFKQQTARPHARHGERGLHFIFIDAQSLVIKQDLNLNASFQSKFNSYPSVRIRETILKKFT